MAKFLCVLIAAAASLGSQTVEGVVTNVATGSGIAGAKVTLQQGDKAVYSAITNAEGGFRIADINPGAYSARYTADRYFSPRGPRDGPRIQIGSGGLPVRIEERMIPLSRVNGRVLDPRGDPVAKARVELTTLSAFWEASTDSKGNFELDSVIPVNSNYTLSASPPADSKPPGPDPNTGTPRGWAPTFYPSSLVLRVGGDLLGLEIKLLAAPLRAVRGVLLNPEGAPVPKVAVALWETGPRRNAAYHAESKPDGTFEFPAVVEGEWRLAAELKSGGLRLLAEEWIAIRGRDTEGVKMRLTPPFTLSGRVILETRPGMPTPKPSEVILIKHHGGQIVFQGASILPVEGEAAGRFSGDIYPGTYRIVPGQPPPGYYLGETRLGDAPVPDDVELSSGSPELTIFYKTNGGTVRGTVEKCGTGQVWLVSRDARPRGHFVGACDATSAGPSHFEIPAVPPGEYYALAVPGGELWPGKVDGVFVQRAARVTVRAGETTQVGLAISSLR